MNNEYDDLLASEGAKDEARTTLRASVIGALPTNPDQYAEAKRLARTTGVPAPVVERNMDEVKKQATLNEYDALIERAPVTASKFQNPEFAKVAHDERDQLAGMESIIASAPQPEIYGSVLTPTGRGIFSPTAQPQPAATPPALDPAKVQAEMLRRFGFKGASTIDRKIDGVLANETRAQLSPWDGKTQEFGYDDAARKGVAMVKLTWDFLADQLAGSLGMDQTETRRIMADTQRYMQGLGKDFDTELAMDLARKQGGDSVVGVLGALPGAIGATDNPFDVVGKFATEQLVASSIGAGVGSVAAAPLRRSAAAYIANQAAARSVGVALTGASASSTAVVLQSLGSNYQEGINTGLTPDEAGRRAWVKTLAEVPANALAGALVGLKIGPNQITNILAQTGVQAAAGGIGAASASVAVGEKIDPLEIALEIAGEGIGAAPDLVVSGALTPASIVSRKFQMEREAQAAAAKASADHLTRIMQAAEASKTRARDPETFAQLVQDAAEASGTAPTEVFIDAQPLVDTLQKAGMTEAQIREMLPSVAEQLDDEYNAGGSVAIPIGEAVTAFAGSGAEADLVRFARTTEDGYSVADSEQALAELEEMNADAQRIIAEQQDAEAWAQSAQAVEDTIFAQLDNANWFSSDVNRTYATLVRNYYVTQADVMGITPEELYRQFPLTVSGVAPTGQVLNQPDGEIATIFDEDGEFTSTDDLIAGLRDGRLLVHARVPDGTDFRYGIEPSAGAFLRSTEAWQQAEEETGAGPELTFFSDSLDWAKSTILQKVRAAEDAGLELVFVRKGDGLQKSLGNGRVVLPDGREVSYEMSPLADYESDLHRAEPAGVESGDWYTNKPQDVVAVAPAADFLKRAEPPTTFDQEVKGTTPYAADTIEVDGKTRPVVNNKGQRIAQTEEGLRNFWRWFGESKVVDAEGRPLVVYHGSDSDIEVFKTDGQGKTSGAGAFFTSNPAVASTYTQPTRGGNISAVYLKIESAAELDAAGANWNRLGGKTKVSLPAVEVSDQSDENLLAELEGREPVVGATKKLKARKTTLGKLFPDEFGYDDDFASTDDIARWARKQGYDGLAIVDVVDRGPSGRMHTKEAADPGALFVAFTNTQIKSIFNRGTYDGSDPNTLNQSAYSDEEIDFLVADGSLSPEQAASLKATAKSRGQNADARTASATGRTQQADARAGRAGEVAGRTVAGTAPRSGWEAATAVRGADGKPARIFRGSIDGAVTPDNFNPEQFGKASGYATSGLGVFFSTWHSDAQKYADNTGGRVGSFFLDIRNPRVITSDQLPEFDSVEQATEFREALRALGHDGIAIDYTEVKGPVQMVAFDPEQVILPGDEVLYQSGVGDGPRLSAIHNLSAENLVFSDKMGGIAVPSIGVVTDEAGGVDGFGEITLIGTKELADPRAEPVFSSDAYSARFPAPEYSKAKTKAVQPLVDSIRAIAKEFGDRSLVDETWDGLINSANVSNVLDKWLSSPATIAMFLREQGIDVAPVKKMDGMQSYLSPEQLRALEPALEQANSDFLNGINDSEAEKKLQDAVREAINAKHGELRPGLAKNLIAKLVPSASNLIDNDLRRVRAGDQVDTWETSTKTRELLAEKGLELKFKDWVEGKILPLVGEPFIKMGREKRPYTLPNIVEAMTDSKVKGKEKTMTYGAGMARAAASVQFNDFEEMRAAAKTAIADPAEYELAKKESEAALDAYRNAVIPYTTYTDWRGQPDTWEALDASMRTIAKWATGKKRDKASLRAALKREGFKVDSLPSDALDLGIAAGNALMNAPVPYFEAKPQRAVSLSEFAGAVIPANAAPEVRAILDKHGIPYREVAEGDNRQAAVRSFTRELNDQGNNVLFQPAYHGSPYRFSKFSLEHMGKGEGAQAYGWGLYFAGSKELADYYRDYLSDSTYAFKVDGNEIDLDSLPPMESIAVQSLGQPYANAPEQLIDRLRSAGASVEDIAAAAEALERYSGRVAYERRNNGQLYRVEIPDDERLLLWDKPLSEQPSQVRDALQKDDLGSDEDSAISEFAKRNNLSLDEAVAFFADEFEVAQRGEEIYRRLAERLGSDEAASKHLNNLGVVGIKFLDGGSRGAGDGSYNYVIFDDAAIEIVNTFYQQQNGKAEARGSFNPTTLNIALREKANLTTFLHEVGHFFFEMQATIAARPDAPARIVDDVNALLKAVGFKGTAAEWLAQPINARRESHEKVAETFEQYLITGEAPTVELQGLFNHMRAWMLSAYKTLKNFFAANKRAGLSAEVVGVFDRLLASDTALAETKRVRAMSPLFKSVEAAGMDAAGWAAYQDDAGQMDADARRDLDARQVRGMKWMRTARSKRLKELQADASAKRRDVRIEARRRLLQEPVYRAMQFLRGKVEKAEVEKKAKGLDTRRDDLLTAIAKLGGLNKDLVVAEWGIDPKDFAKSPVFGKPILRSGKAGLSPDGMAEALAEVGYLQPKDGDRYALSDFEAMFNDSARGIQHYSLDADYDLIHGYKTLPVAADLGEQPFAAGRLSRPDLEARFGGTDVDWQRLGVGRRGMIAEVGMDADAVANIVGFNTGEEMVKALLAAESLHDATEALTDQIMLERYGDITSPEGLQRAADAALANDAHAKLLATEYVRLNKAVGSPRAVQMAAKEAAERMVDRQAVRLARPDKSTAAAARAGKATEKAHAAGNLDEAAGFKRNQILNTAIARAQRELRAFVEKAQGDFANMFGKDDQRAKTRDMNLVNLARAALAQYGLAPEAGGVKALQYLELVTQYDPALAENLKSMLAAMPEGKDFRDLTAGEFRTVASLVRGMWEMSRGVKQITIDGKKVEIDAAADELVAAVLANNGGEQGNLPGYSGTTTTADDLRVGALGIKSMLTRVEQWADFMGPAFKRFIWQPVSEAVTRYRVRRNEMVKQYRDLLKAIEPDLTFHKIHAPELGLGGFTFNAGKSEVLHAILHSGNESNLRKLLLGRGWATVDEAGNLDTSRWDAFVKRMAAEGVITRADMDFVQGVWDLLETVKGDAQKAHRELYGYYFNEVTATPFVDPFGVERRGGYVPALADGLSSPDAMQKREQEELLHAGNSFMFPSTGKGFTQSRVEYNRPLELDLRSIGSHLDKVTRFAYIEPAVRDVGKLLINKRVARALNGYDQTIISHMLNPWLQRAARQTVSVPGKNRWADKFFNGLRTRSGVVLMFANVVNALQQLGGFSVALLKVPAPALLRAAYMVARDPKRMAAEAAALAPWLAERMAGQSFEMQQEIKNILVNPNPLVKGNEFLKHNAYFMQQGLQNIMDLIVWWGAYDNAVANGANQRDAIRASNEAVRTTQGSFAPEDVSAFESNTAFVRLFMQFYGYFNMLANTLGYDAKKAIRDMGYGAATPRLLFIWFVGLALPAVVAEIIARGLPDDEDDEDGDGTLDEWLALFFGSQGRTLAAMAPGIGQGVSLAVNLTDDKVYNDRLSISPGMSMAETTIRGGVNLLQGEVFDERLTKTEVRDTLTLIGMATGAPTGALARSAGYLVDVENGRADPETPVDYAIGLTTGR